MRQPSAIPTGHMSSPREKRQQEDADTHADMIVLQLQLAERGRALAKHELGADICSSESRGGWTPAVAATSSRVMLAGPLAEPGPGPEPQPEPEPRTAAWGGGNTATGPDQAAENVPVPAATSAAEAPSCCVPGITGHGWYPDPVLAPGAGGVTPSFLGALRALQHGIDVLFVLSWTASSADHPRESEAIRRATQRAERLMKVSRAQPAYMLGQGLTHATAVHCGGARDCCVW